MSITTFIALELFAMATIIAAYSIYAEWGRTE